MHASSKFYNRNTQVEIYLSQAVRGRAEERIDGLVLTENSGVVCSCAVREGALMVRRFAPFWRYCLRDNRHGARHTKGGNRAVE